MKHDTRNNDGPLFAVSVGSDRRPSGLQEGFPYSNKGNLQQKPQVQQQPQQQQQTRPNNQHQYNYNNTSKRLEKVY